MKKFYLTMLFVAFAAVGAVAQVSIDDVGVNKDKPSFENDMKVHQLDGDYMSEAKQRAERINKQLLVRYLHVFWRRCYAIRADDPSAHNIHIECGSIGLLASYAFGKLGKITRYRRGTELKNSFDDSAVVFFRAERVKGV